MKTKRIVKLGKESMFFIIVLDLTTQFRTQSIAIDASILDIQRKLNNLDLLITLVSGK